MLILSKIAALQSTRYIYILRKVYRPFGIYADSKTLRKMILEC